MNKKSMIFNIFLVLMTLLMLTYAYIGLTDKYVDVDVSIKPFDVIRTYQQGEKELLYIDQSAQYSLQQTLYTMGTEGGFYDVSPCGEYLGDAIWGDGCFPNYKDNIKKYFKDNMDFYVSNNNLAFTQEYDLNLNGDDTHTEIVGIAPFYLFISHEKVYVSPDHTTNYPIEDNILNINEYAIKPSFRVSETHALNDYETLKNGVGQIGACVDADVDLQNCMGGQVGALSVDYLEWRDSSCDVGYEKIFYDLIEQLEGCKNSVTRDCQCLIDLNYPTDEYYLEGEYEFRFRNEPDGTTHVSLFAKGKDQIKKSMIDDVIEGSYYFVHGAGGVGENIEYSLSVTYTNGKLDNSNLPSWDHHKPKLAKVEGNTLLQTFEDGKIYVYKIIDEPNTAYFVGFPGDLANQDCSVEKEYFRVCVKNKDVEYNVYDPVLSDAFLPENVDGDEVVVQHPITHNFVYFMEDLPPPEINGVRTSDKDSDENTIIVRWEASNAEDIAYYRIYYSTSPFSWSDLRVSNDGVLDQSSGIPSIIVRADVETRDYNNGDLDIGQSLGNCEYKYDYAGNREEITDNGYSTDNYGDSYRFCAGDTCTYVVALTGLQNGQQYHIIVVAIDKHGNELNSEMPGSTLSRSSATPEDNLAPRVDNSNLRDSTSNHCKAPCCGDCEDCDVTITYTFPTKNIDNSNIQESQITCRIDGLGTISKPPGSSGEFTVHTSGNYQYSMKCWGDEGQAGACGDVTASGNCPRDEDSSCCPPPPAP